MIALFSFLRGMLNHQAVYVAAPGGGPSGSAYLLEDGSYLLLEDGSFILVE